MNNDDVINILKILHPRNELIEIRIPKAGFKGKEVYAGYFDDVDKCCKIIEKYNGVVPAIYTNLNPINPALLARANNRIDEKAGLAAQDSDVIQRTWLYIDIDPVRPAGISSTNNEHDQAIARAHEINEKQTQEGWSEGVICDSGNGASILFKIDLPNTEVSTNLIKKVLNAFDFFYSDEKIQIDTSVFNAARIIKLYGTVTKKGDSTTERPHRISAILSIPEHINPVSLEQLIEFAAKVPEEPESEYQNLKNNNKSFDIQKWIHEHHLIVSKKKSWNGGMLYVLDECPFDSNHKSPDACIIQGKSGALGFRCLHNSCRNHDWKALRAFKDPNIELKQTDNTTHNKSVDFDVANLTDLGNAKLLIQQFGNQIRFCPEWQKWLVLNENDNMWHRDTSGEIYGMAREVLTYLRESADKIPNMDIANKYREHTKLSESLHRIEAFITLAQTDDSIIIHPNELNENNYDEYYNNTFLGDASNDEPITLTERRLQLTLPDNHFVSEYVRWLSSLSDGYVDYQILCAFWLLSALTKGRAFLRLKQELIKPNIWGICVGASTTSRKSTIVNKTRKVYEIATESILYNDDYSIEGYLETLSQHPISNHVRDEAAGLFAKFHKRYNEGIFEAECAIYDCQNYKKTLASGKDKKPKTFEIDNPFVTKLYATTPDNLARYLTIDDFLSGYGYRLLYALPNYKHERMPLEVETKEDVAAWANIMVKTKTIYQKFNALNMDMSFKVEPEAMIFYNQIIERLEINADLNNNDMLNSVIGRAQIHILKLAMLIELGKQEMSQIITTESIRIASDMVIQYFIPSIMEVLDRLSEDIKSNKIEKIRAIIRRLGGQAAHTKLLRDSHLTSKEFLECVTTMQESHEIQIITNTRTKIYRLNQHTIKVNTNHQDKIINIIKNVRKLYPPNIEPDNISEVARTIIENVYCELQTLNIESNRTEITKYVNDYLST